MRAGLTIGQLARELQLNPRTIRYYEQVGLLPRPQRSESGYRLYAGDEKERLQLIRRAKLLGLSLAEIKEIVDYAIDGHCGLLQGRLLSLVEAKLGEIDGMIQDLLTLREDLKHYRGDLSSRLVSVAQEESCPASPARCLCIGDEVDSIGKQGRS